jgi:hypothetical protein
MDPLSILIDLWIARPEGQPGEASVLAILNMEKPYTYTDVCEVVSFGVAGWTNPQIIAIAWRPTRSLQQMISKRMVADGANSALGSTTFGLHADDRSYVYGPDGGLYSFDLSEMPEVRPGEMVRWVAKYRRENE